MWCGERAVAHFRHMIILPRLRRARCQTRPRARGRWAIVADGVWRTTHCTFFCRPYWLYRLSCLEVISCSTWGPCLFERWGSTASRKLSRLQKRGCCMPPCYTLLCQGCALQKKRVLALRSVQWFAWGCLRFQVDCFHSLPCFRQVLRSLTGMHKLDM